MLSPMKLGQGPGGLEFTLLMVTGFWSRGLGWSGKHRGGKDLSQATPPGWRWGRKEGQQGTRRGCSTPSLSACQVPTLRRRLLGQ